MLQNVLCSASAPNIAFTMLNTVSSNTVVTQCLLSSSLAAQLTQNPEDQHQDED